MLVDLFRHSVAGTLNCAEGKQGGETVLTIVARGGVTFMISAQDVGDGF